MLSDDQAASNAKHLDEIEARFHRALAGERSLRTEAIGDLIRIGRNLLADRALRVAEAERLRAELDQLRGLGRRLSDALHSHDGSLLIEDGPVESQLYNFDAWLGHGESGG